MACGASLVMGAQLLLTGNDCAAPTVLGRDGDDDDRHPGHRAGPCWRLAMRACVARSNER
jgi:hypothetical protein